MNQLIILSACFCLCLILIFVAGVCVFVCARARVCGWVGGCLYSSTMKASDCKMSERYLRRTDQRSCVVNIYLGVYAKFVHLCI